VDRACRERTRQKIHHGCDVFRVLRVPGLFWSHQSAGIDQLSLVNERQHGDPRRFVTSVKSDDSAFLRSDRLRTNHDPEWIEQLAQSSKALGVIVIPVSDNCGNATAYEARKDAVNEVLGVGRRGPA